jgi:hypothetical protein
MRNAITLLVGSSILMASSAAFAQQYGGQTGASTQGGTWGGTYGPGVPARNDTADNIGQEMQIVFGAERLMGVFATTITAEPEVGGDTTVRNTQISLFGHAPGSASAGALSLGPSASTIPRLALDFFVTEGFSVGGSFIYMRFSGEVETDAATNDQPTQTEIVFHPRLGYSFIIDETFAIWPRAGITWSRGAIEFDTAGGGTTENSLSSFQLSADVPVVISPMEHFAILIGPYLDLGLSATATTDDGTNSQDTDGKVTSYGLTTGIAGYF